jgi:hypothetical protein
MHPMVFVRRCAIVAAFLAVAGCVSNPARSQASSDIFERSTLHLSKPPERAAACLSDHAQSAGRSAEVVPLYGLESVAVTVKATPTGDVLAVLSLMRADAGASAAVTTWKGAVPDRADFLNRLAEGC